MQFIHEKKLEELLVLKWAEFLDVPKFMAFVTQVVQNQVHNLTVLEQHRPRSGKQITMSRFQIVPQGFLLWAEFVIPIEPRKIAVGTCEMILTNTGDLSHQQTLGELYCSPT